MSLPLRHELKYLISRQQAALLQNRLRPFLTLDPHSLDHSLGYQVTSLYFDDYQLSSYFEKLDGVEERIKFRLRTYNFDPQVINFETKIKKGELCQKSAIALDSTQYQQLKKGNFAQLQKQNPDLALAAQLKLLTPRLVIDYQRLAFIKPDSNDLRITFDDHLQISHSSFDLFTPEAHAWQTVLPPHLLILEVKYNQYFPIFLSQLFSAFPLHQIAVSKYIFCQQLARNRNLCQQLLTN